MTIVRTAFAIGVTVALTWLWFPRLANSENIVPILGMALIGFAGGYLLRSEWAVTLIPATFNGAALLYERKFCASCALAETTTLQLVDVVIVALTLLLPAVGAALGAYAAMRGQSGRHYSKHA